MPSPRIIMNVTHRGLIVFFFKKPVSVKPVQQDCMGHLTIYGA